MRVSRDLRECTYTGMIISSNCVCSSIELGVLVRTPVPGSGRPITRRRNDILPNSRAFASSSRSNCLPDPIWIKECTRRSEDCAKILHPLRESESKANFLIYLALWKRIETNRLAGQGPLSRTSFAFGNNIGGSVVRAELQLTTLRVRILTIVSSLKVFHISGIGHLIAPDWLYDEVKSSWCSWSLGWFHAAANSSTSKVHLSSRTMCAISGWLLMIPQNNLCRVKQLGWMLSWWTAIPAHSRGIRWFIDGRLAVFRLREMSTLVYSDVVDLARICLETKRMAHMCRGFK